jgi:ABC-type dipeptide/oligopeptide/nickel transport system ATPase component
MIADVSVIAGDSGSGKSFVCDKIKAVKKFPGRLISSSIPLENIEVWRQDSDIKPNIKDKLIILDRYPVYENKDMLIDMMKRLDNKFIVMTHTGAKSIPLDCFLKYRLVRSEDGKQIKTVDFYRFTPVEKLKLGGLH